MSLLPALTAESAVFDSVELSSAVSQPVSLEQRMLDALARATLADEQQRNAITRASADPQVSANPASLISWQIAMSTDQIEMNLASTLARKSAGCIETLIKAQ
jgi:hypothetical protein